MIKTAIIGLGTISTIHRHSIENSINAELTCVCDIDESKKTGYENINFYTNIDDMLANEKIDCVHICLPHYLHYPIIKKCAENGVNVFSEKPLTITFEEAKELFALEDTYNVKIGVCLQNRYNATSLALKEIFEKKEFGEFLGSKGIVTWARTMNYYDSAPWRGKIDLAGSGVMMNQSIHTLDLLSFICGEFDTVEAKIANFSLKQTEIEDSVMAYLKYKHSNATSVYFATIAYCENSSVELEVAFKDAIFKITNNALYKYSKDGNIEFVCADEKLSGTKHYYGASHNNIIQAFHNSIKDNTNDYVSLKEASYSLKLIENIMLSNSENKPINID